MIMRVFKIFLIILAVMVMAFVLLGAVHQPSSATPVDPLPERVEIRCEADEPVCRFKLKLPGDDMDIEVLRQGPLPTVVPSTIRVPGPTVTIRPPRATVRVPGPVRTVPGPVRTRTVRPPRATVTLPGEVRTETSVRPGPTVTIRPDPIGPSQAPEPPAEIAPRITVTDGAPQITATSRPRPTVTITDSPAPRITVTDEFIAPTTGQTPPSRGTLGQEPKTDIPGIQFPDLVPDLSDPGPVQTVGLSIIGIIAMLTLVLGAMYVGYTLGWKDSDKSNAGFLRSLRDQLAMKK
jgi:hypothetical protein